jgi:hypothetical protein
MMRVISYAIDDDGFLTYVLDDASHAFEHLFTPGFLQEVGSALYCKFRLDVILCECSGDCGFLLFLPFGVLECLLLSSIIMSPLRGCFPADLIVELRALRLFALFFCFQWESNLFHMAEFG